MMLIILFLGLALFAVVAVLLRKRHLRNKDKLKGRFNDGITGRSMTAVPEPPAFQQDSGRATPRSVSRHGGTDSRFASVSNLSRVRERDATEQIDSMPRTRGTTPLGEVERGGVLTNKKRVDISENEIGPA